MAAAAVEADLIGLDQTLPCEAVTPPVAKKKIRIVKRRVVRKKSTAGGVEDEPASPSESVGHSESPGTSLSNVSKEDDDECPDHDSPIGSPQEETSKKFRRVRKVKRQSLRSLESGTSPSQSPTQLSPTSSPSASFCAPTTVSLSPTTSSTGLGALPTATSPAQSPLSAKPTRRRRIGTKKQEGGDTNAQMESPNASQSSLCMYGDAVTSALSCSLENSTLSDMAVREPSAEAVAEEPVPVPQTQPKPKRKPRVKASAQPCPSEAHPAAPVTQQDSLLGSAQGAPLGNKATFNHKARLQGAWQTKSGTGCMLEVAGLEVTFKRSGKKMAITELPDGRVDFLGAQIEMAARDNSEIIWSDKDVWVKREVERSYKPLSLEVLKQG